MYTGQLTSLAAVVTFFSLGGDTSGYSGTNELSALGLSTQDESDVVAFLKTLDGPGANPNLEGSP
jgi:hypothetical protein